MTLALLTLLVQATIATTPYLQLGAQPGPSRMSIVWLSSDVDADWSVQHRAGANAAWIDAARLETRRIRLRDTPAMRRLEAVLDRLTPGAEFDYRVVRGGEVVFNGHGKANAALNSPTRVALLGDTGQGTRGQREVAARMYQANPDAVIVTGDIVYPSGRLRYYFSRWFPILNSSATPLLRSRVSAAAPGNHDLEECPHLGAKPDCLSYFYVWSQPLNGPAATAVEFRGPDEDKTAFRQAAGPAFPRMANFSFETGGIHWTVLDSNHVNDWTRPDLQAWLEDDLSHAKTTWRFAVLHHIPFHSSHKHAEQQRMRVLAPIFEKHGVKVVFSGHVHNYQRTHAITFAPDAKHPLGDRQRITGKVARDPKGVIYWLTGAGGAGLHDGSLSGRPDRWQSFTAKFEARQHSFTLVETLMDGGRQTVRIKQVGADGSELDSVSLARE